MLNKFLKIECFGLLSVFTVFCVIDGKPAINPNIYANKQPSKYFQTVQQSQNAEPKSIIAQEKKIIFSNTNQQFLNSNIANSNGLSSKDSSASTQFPNKFSINPKEKSYADADNKKNTDANIFEFQKDYLVSNDLLNKPNELLDENELIINEEKENPFQPHPPSVEADKSGLFLQDSPHKEDFEKNGNLQPKSKNSTEVEMRDSEDVADSVLLNTLFKIKSKSFPSINKKLELKSLKTSSNDIINVNNSPIENYLSSQRKNFQTNRTNFPEITVVAEGNNQSLSTELSQNSEFGIRFENDEQVTESSVVDQNYLLHKLIEDLDERLPEVLTVNHPVVGQSDDTNFQLEVGLEEISHQNEIDFINKSKPVDSLKEDKNVMLTIEKEISSIADGISIQEMNLFSELDATGVNPLIVEKTDNYENTNEIDKKENFVENDKTDILEVLKTKIATDKSSKNYLSNDGFSFSKDYGDFEEDEASYYSIQKQYEKNSNFASRLDEKQKEKKYEQEDRILFASYHDNLKEKKDDWQLNEEFVKTHETMAVEVIVPKPDLDYVWLSEMKSFQEEKIHQKFPVDSKKTIDVQSSFFSKNNNSRSVYINYVYALFILFFACIFVVTCLGGCTSLRRLYSVMVFSNKRNQPHWNKTRYTLLPQSNSKFA